MRTFSGQEVQVADLVELPCGGERLFGLVLGSYEESVDVLVVLGTRYGKTLAERVDVVTAAPVSSIVADGSRWRSK